MYVSEYPVIKADIALILKKLAANKAAKNPDPAQGEALGMELLAIGLDLGFEFLADMKRTADALQSIAESLKSGERI